MASTMESIWWTEGKEENLVILWSEKPCLFNILGKDYSNRVTKEKACEDIANKINMPGEQLLVLSLFTYAGHSFSACCGSEKSR